MATRGHVGEPMRALDAAAGLRWAVVMAVIIAVALVAVAAGRATHRSDAQAAVTMDPQADVWIQHHGSQWSWMQTHWDEMVALQPHAGDTAWVRANLTDWAWIDGHPEAVMMLHDRWQQMTAAHAGAMPRQGMGP